VQPIPRKLVGPQTITPSAAAGRPRARNRTRVTGKADDAAVTATSYAAATESCSTTNNAILICRDNCGCSFRGQHRHTTQPSVADQSPSGRITFVRNPSTSTSRIVSALFRRMSAQASGVWKALCGVTISRPVSQGSRRR